MVIIEECLRSLIQSKLLTFCFESCFGRKNTCVTRHRWRPKNFWTRMFSKEDDIMLELLAFDVNQVCHSIQRNNYPWHRLCENKTVQNQMWSIFLSPLWNRLHGPCCNLVNTIPWPCCDPKVKVVPKNNASCPAEHCWFCTRVSSSSNLRSLRLMKSPA